MFFFFKNYFMHERHIIKTVFLLWPRRHQFVEMWRSDNHESSWIEKSRCSYQKYWHFFQASHQLPCWVFKFQQITVLLFVQFIVICFCLNLTLKCKYSCGSQASTISAKPQEMCHFLWLLLIWLSPRLHRDILWEQDRSGSWWPPLHLRLLWYSPKSHLLTCTNSPKGSKSGVV